MPNAPRAFGYPRGTSRPSWSGGNSAAAEGDILCQAADGGRRGGVESQAVTVFAQWVRRCARCLTVDQRAAWHDPDSAQSDPKLGERRRWYEFRRARWECHACGCHEYTVEPRDPLRRGPPE
jgi:hypothetical protein